MSTTKALTPKGAATRQRIIQGTSAEVRERGAAATTLDDVCARTSTSKSQIFHYFPGGKEELLLAVAAYEADRVLFDQEPYLSSLTSWDAWQGWRDQVVRRYRKLGVHCPLGVLITELGRKTPAAQALTGQLLEQWQGRLRAGVTAMQEIGEISPELDADQIAASLMATVQGGVVLLLSTGKSDHLEAALDTSLALLRATAAPVKPGDPELLHVGASEDPT